MKSYVITMNSSLLGNCHFNFRRSDSQEIIISTEFKKSEKEVPIRYEDHPYTIMRARQGRQMTLRAESQFGPDLWTVRYLAGPGKDRICRCLFVRRLRGMPEGIGNDDRKTGQARPHDASSIKNCVICDDRDRLFLKVTKLSSDTLGIEAIAAIPPLYVFIVGASAFLCPSKV